MRIIGQYIEDVDIILKRPVPKIIAPVMVIGIIIGQSLNLAIWRLDYQPALLTQFKAYPPGTLVTQWLDQPSDRIFFSRTKGHEKTLILVPTHYLCIFTHTLSLDLFHLLFRKLDQTNTS